MAENEVTGNEGAPKTKKGGAKKILLLLAVAVFFGLPILALAVGIGIIPRGGSFNPLKAPSTALAANVECVLRFPADASADDKLIGRVFDEFIKTQDGGKYVKLPNESPMVKEFAGKTEGLGEAIAKSGRAGSVNPSIIVSMAYLETRFATDVNAKSSRSKFNPFGRRNNSGDYIDFGSYKKAIDEHGPYLKRVYLDFGLTTVLDMMNKYAPASDGNNPAEYAQKIGTISSELVLLAQTSFQSALGSDVCPLPSAQSKVL